MATDMSHTHEPVLTSTPAPRPVAVPAPKVVQEAPSLYRLRIDQYEAMAANGILRDGEKVELIEGLLVSKITKGNRHYSLNMKLNHALNRLLPEGWLAAIEAPLILERSEPEPDVMIVRGRIDDPLLRRPEPDSVALVVEIADTSYAQDHARLPLFAEPAIPVCWIVHIPAGRIEVYSDPTGPDPSPTYRRRDDYARGSRVPVVLDGAVAFELAVDDLLPPAE